MDKNKDYRKIARLFFIVMTVTLTPSMSFLAIGALVENVILLQLSAVCFVPAFISAFGFVISLAIYSDKEFERTGVRPPFETIRSLLFNKNLQEKMVNIRESDFQETAQDHDQNKRNE